MAGIIVDTNNNVCGDIRYTFEDDDALSDGSSDRQQHSYNPEAGMIEAAPPQPPPESEQRQQVEAILLEAEEVVEEDDDSSKRVDCYKKTALTFILVAFVAFVIVDAATSQYIKTGINSFFEWMAANPREGFFGFVVVSFASTMLFIPGILLAIGGGFAFSNAFGLGVGILVGTVAVFIGFATGAIVSFLLGRFLLRDCVSGLTKRFSILEALDNAFEEKGFRIMVLLRLSPLIYAAPALNYGAGGTSISFKDYTLAMWAIIPCTVFFVFLGASAGSLASDGGEEDEGSTRTNKIVMIIGIVVSVIAAAWTSYYAKVELNKVAAASRQEEEEEEAREGANENEEDEEAQLAEEGEDIHERTTSLHDAF
jgi:uncharacterized membrane protein YdjX (TVP38/TMEM64 family)